MKNVSFQVTLTSVALLWLACFFPVPAQSPDEGQVLDSTRSAMSRWVETQQIISKEKKDWQLGKEVLLQRIELIESEIKALESKIAETRQAIDQADHEKADLVAKNKALEDAAGTLTDRIGPLEAKTMALLPVLPEPIVERIEPLSRRIPRDPAATEASLGERFQNVIGILNEVDKFNNDITVTSELRKLPDGTTAEVSAIYVGLGQAYYVTSSGSAAGVGRATEAGWEWTAADHLAPEISQAVAILKGTGTPAFVPLPVEIR